MSSTHVIWIVALVFALMFFRSEWKRHAGPKRTRHKKERL